MTPLLRFALPFLCATPVVAADAARRPNVVLIVIDDLGQRDLGCYGSTFHETPHVDRLAAGGMSFTNYYAANPVCSPTRASLQTGRNPARLHLTDWLKGRRQPPDSPVLSADYADELPLSETTLGELFSAAHYSTAFVGKWHLGGPAFYPEHQGYAVDVAGSAAGSPKSYFSPKWKPGIPIDGDFEGQYLTDLLSERACGIIEKAAKANEPFFLALCHYTVHIPLQPKPDLLAKYEAKRSRTPEVPDTQANPYYAAMVESMDTSVGRVLDTLERLKIADDTLVIFTSDNGGLSVKEGAHTPATTNAPLRAGKGYLYEGGIRDAFIVRWPGVTQPGATCDVPAISDDVLPTLAAAAGYDATGLTLDGRDLSPLLRGKADAALSGRPLFWHYPHFSNQGGMPGGAVRRGDWKLIEWFKDGRTELYNLADDLEESHDRSAEQPELAKELRALLHDWRRTTRANMPKPNPAYHGDAKPVTSL